MKLKNREISPNVKPLIVPDICINHFGNFDNAYEMINKIYYAGGEIVKFQMHIPSAEMLKKEAEKIVPANSTDGSSIYDIIKSCSFSFEEEKELKRIVERKNMIYLSTPFSKEAVDRLEEMNVELYKVGSGELNNLPLIEYIASKRKPMILSTGMGGIKEIFDAVKVLNKYDIDFVLLACTSLYPTPYEKSRLGSIKHLQDCFGNDIIGISDHSIGNYIGYAATALGSVVVEKHFTNDKRDIGPDVEISMDFEELSEMIKGCEAIWKARGGEKTILPEEQVTINFAYASVVSVKDIKKGELLTKENCWVKRPGTGEILAKDFDKVLGKKAKIDIKKDRLLSWNMIE